MSKNREVRIVDPVETDFVSDETLSHLQAGSEYQQLISFPGWNRLLDDLEARANDKLKSLRECLSSDLVVIAALRRQWVEAEESLKFVQIRAGEAISRRKAIIDEMEVVTGFDFHTDPTSDEKISRFLDAVRLGKPVNNQTNNQQQNGHSKENK